MGQDQQSSPEAAWLWNGSWKERSGVLPPLDESPLRQDSVTAANSVAVGPAGWPSRGALRNWADWGLLEKGLLSQKLVHADLIPLHFRLS